MNGLELIKHTAGGGVMTATTTGGSVSLVKNGKIEFTNATEIHVDKCFDVPVNPGDEPLYDNYLIVLRNKTTSTTGFLPFTLRRSGTNATGGNYTSQRITADDRSVSGARTPSETSARLIDGVASSTSTGTHVYIYGPALAQPTAMRSVGAGVRGNAWLEDFAVTHSLATAYDGFSFKRADIDTITGSLTIYGFTKGQTP